MVDTVLLTLLTLITGGVCIPDKYLYCADYSLNQVYRIDPTQPLRYSVPVIVQNPTAVGYDTQTEHLYVVNGLLTTLNTTSKYILKYHFNSGSTQRLELLRSAVVRGMAVDSASSLLYYAERTENVIVAVTTDFRYQTIIIDTDLEEPVDIALDTVNKVIYWCDASQTFPYIGKANMDGSLRRNIIVHGLYLPYAITLDVPANKIYWVDRTLNKIERCNTDGTGREIVLSLNTGEQILFSVALDETYLYWVQRLRGAIFKRKKSGVQAIQRIGSEYPVNTTDYRYLRLVSTSPSPQGTNSCSGRGGCQHICIPTAQSQVCRCSEGYVLQPDGTSCQEAPFSRGVVTVDINTRVLIVLDLETNITRRLTDTWYSDPTGIALDETTFEIFWADRSRRTVFRTCIPTPCFQVIKIYTQESFLGDLAIDSQRKILFVGDSGLERITKMSYSGNQEEVIIQDRITSQVVQIALDTRSRKIYWATVNTIEVANMDDGSARRQLQTSFIIGGLVLDTQTQKLYVLRFDINKLEVIDLTRSDSLQPVHQESGTSSLVGLALGDGMLYFSNRKEASIYELNIATQEVKKYGPKRFPRTLSIVYFNQNPKTPVSVTTPATVPGATPEGIMTTASSGGGLLNQTLVIALSVSIGGLIIIVGIIICGVVIYKRTLTSVTPTTTPRAVDIPLGQVPSPRPKQVHVSVIESSGEYAELRQFPTLHTTRPPLPLPPQLSPNRLTGARDPSYMTPVVPPSMQAKKYQSKMHPPRK